MSLYNFAFKYILIGDSYVGKSSLLAVLTGQPFSLCAIPTIGVDMGAKHFQIDATAVKLRVWDLAGSPQFRSIVESYFREVGVGVVVYDITSRASFLSVPGYIQKIRSTNAENTEILLLGNKTDQDARIVTKDEGLALAKSLGCQFAETSCLDPGSVIEAFRASAELLLDRVQSEGVDGLPGVAIGTLTRGDDKVTTRGGSFCGCTLL
jgi:small GTP-binding protein